MFEGSTLVGQFIGTKVQIFLPLGAKVQFWGKLWIYKKIYKSWKLWISYLYFLVKLSQ